MFYKEGTVAPHRAALNTWFTREQFLFSLHFQIFIFTVFWDSQVALCVQTAVPFRRCVTVTNTPVQCTTGRRGLGGFALKTPLPWPSTPPWESVPAATVKVPAPWECRLAKSSVFGSMWDRCRPRSKLLFVFFCFFQALLYAPFKSVIVGICAIQMCAGFILK